MTLFHSGYLFMLQLRNVVTSENGLLRGLLMW